MDEQILNAIQATSVILVFVTLFFSMKYPEIMKSINKNHPVAGEVAMKNAKDELKSSFFVNCLPQIVVNTIFGYLFLPISIKVIQNSVFKIWNFDFLPTAFIFIVVWIWVLLIWNIYISIKLLQKICKYKLK